MDLTKSQTIAKAFKLSDKYVNLIDGFYPWLNPKKNIFPLENTIPEKYILWYLIEIALPEMVESDFLSKDFIPSADELNRIKNNDLIKIFEEGVNHKTNEAYANIFNTLEYTERDNRVFLHQSILENGERGAKDFFTYTECYGKKLIEQIDTNDFKKEYWDQPLQIRLEISRKLVRGLSKSEHGRSYLKKCYSHYQGGNQHFNLWSVETLEDFTYQYPDPEDNITEEYLYRQKDFGEKIVELAIELADQFQFNIEIPEHSVRNWVERGQLTLSAAINFYQEGEFGFYVDGKYYDIHRLKQPSFLDEIKKTLPTRTNSKDRTINLLKYNVKKSPKISIELSSFIQVFLLGWQAYDLWDSQEKIELDKGIAVADTLSQLAESIKEKIDVIKNGGDDIPINKLSKGLKILKGINLGFMIIDMGFTLDEFLEARRNGDMEKANMLGIYITSLTFSMIGSAIGLALTNTSATVILGYSVAILGAIPLAMSGLGLFVLVIYIGVSYYNYRQRSLQQKEPIREWLLNCYFGANWLDDNLSKPNVTNPTKPYYRWKIDVPYYKDVGLDTRKVIYKSSRIPKKEGLLRQVISFFSIIYPIKISTAEIYSSGENSIRLFLEMEFPVLHDNEIGVFIKFIPNPDIPSKGMGVFESEIDLITRSETIFPYYFNPRDNSTKTNFRNNTGGDSNGEASFIKRMVNEKIVSSNDDNSNKWSHKVEIIWSRRTNNSNINYNDLLNDYKYVEVDIITGLDIFPEIKNFFGQPRNSNRLFDYPLILRQGAILRKS